MPDRTLPVEGMSTLFSLRRETRDARNNARLLSVLEYKRAAHYVCVMVLVRSPADPRPLVAEGLWHGEIGREPRGSNGFGYDPLFVLPDGRHVAELNAEEKNRLSHRAQALRRLLEALRDPGQP